MTIDLQEWRKLASREFGGKPPEELVWRSIEGLEVKPLYTSADLSEAGYEETLPGFEPFVRGPRATMYTGRPWTVRQYAGFSTAEESNAFYKRETL